MEEKVEKVVDDYINDEPEDDRPIEDIPVEELDLTTRTYCCFQRHGIRTLGDILKTTLHDLVLIRNFGRKSLEEVQEVLKKYGYMYDIVNHENYNEVPGIIIGGAAFREQIKNNIEDNIKSLADKILELWGKGYNTLGIAEELNISESTVREKLTTAGIQFGEISLHRIADDNRKAADELAKKMFELEKENVALRSKYEKLNSMYLKCGSERENLKTENDKLKKENEELEQTNKMLSNGKLEDMQANNELRTKIEKLLDVIRAKDDRLDQCRSDYSKLYNPKNDNAEDHDIMYLLHVILRKMDENHQPMFVTVIDNMLVDIHSSKYEPKKPSDQSYSITTRQDGI